jgi:flavin reductase (DIM6/NTAB) family NADH-FMN oxidoreductase RutF
LKTTDYFAAPAWQPLCIVGSHGPDETLNAQICISISSASIVPERPRLLVVLWKQNLTHELVLQSGTLSVSVMTSTQLGLIEPLGLETGRHGPKLTGLDLRITESGDPYFPDSAGYADCAVVGSLDLGDCTAFLTLVRTEDRLSGTEPITWDEASKQLAAELMQRYQEKLEGDRDLARRSMLWFA